MRIEEARGTAVRFLKDVLGKEGVVVKTSQTPEGWEVGIEVAEESEYMKALGVRARVVDRSLYELKLSDALEVLSYELKRPLEPRGAPPAPKRA